MCVQTFLLFSLVCVSLRAEFVMEEDVRASMLDRLYKEGKLSPLKSFPYEVKCMLLFF